MQIYGLNKTTLLDYPEHIAATIFTGGCNFRCPFCHNADLVSGCNKSELELLKVEDVLNFLDKRKGILEGVCITGGEPTLQKDLKHFVRRVKGLGYLVKLDTNGYRPDVLYELLEEELLDYVAMDIKAAKVNYRRAAGLKDIELHRIEESISLLKSSTISYEFRTTVVKGIHEITEFEQIGRWLMGSRAYYLQAYRENENVLAIREAGQNSKIAVCEELHSYTKEEMYEMAALARKYIDRVEVRGIE